MSDLQIVSAQPIEVEISGKAYKFSPLTVGNWARLEDWAEKELKAKDKSISRDTITEHCFSFAAIPQKVFLMLRRNHPEITLADAENLLTLENYHIIEARFSGVFVNTDIELLRAAKAIAQVKANGQDETESRAALEKLIERAVSEVQQGKARPTENG